MASDIAKPQLEVESKTPVSGGPSLPSIRKSHDSVENGEIYHSTDDHRLEQIGYKQEFHREFTRLSTLSYAVSIMGVLGSVPGTWSSPLAAGGPATAVWCWFSGSIFSLCIALSVAELVSAYPTSGGMYFVTKNVFPERYVPLAAWVIGWSNFLGQTAGVASVDYTVAQMVKPVILAAVSMGSVGEDGIPTYVPYLGEYNCGVNLIASVAISIAILVLTPNKLPASKVFGTITDGSGWNNKGLSFLIGYLSVAWTMTDYDATAHMSEELKNAAMSGPVAIFQAVLFTWVFGFLLNIALGFCAGNVADILASPMGNPAAQVFFNAAGRSGGLAMWIWPIIVQFFTGITAMLSDTRTAYALARDGALPLSGVFRQVNGTTHTPLYSVWIVVFFCCCLNLIALGSTETIDGIFDVTSPAMDLSYITVIAARQFFKHESPIAKGPFDLGKWRKPINYIAIVWTIFVSIFLFFPPSYPVTPENMNYAIVIAGFIALLSFTWWYAEARKSYIGPRTQS
ncbi:hypothetical protein UA08_08457 [Talaromyces atroroseus]|uniref:Amino-acid permease n=1 Tax=Talaromyces atroroseus TaxID=1441469 RepID=A0A1Q5Q7H5_TALAT|nr:hypothetical protein UA08_08457 [Talaromyces atroroseus]OKL56163.1 hypothetical protein UA08_08457 [Talaromyces atroroseus]